MPYCSLEEAWGGNFVNETEQDKPEDEISFSNIDSNEGEYMSINYEDTSGDDNLIKNKLYNRNMSRLPNHSGPMNRYTSHNNQNKISYSNNIDNDWYPKKELVIESPPSYLNLDLPLNKYDNDLKNKLLSKQIGNDNYNYNNLIDEKYIKENNNINKATFIKKDDNIKNPDGYSSDDSDDSDDSENSIERDINMIDNTKKHNTDRKIFTKYNKQKRHSNLNNDIYKSLNSNDNNIYDVVIYITTGIFIIFILDIFTKLGKRRT